MEILIKSIVNSGFADAKEAELYIKNGLVTVNGNVIKDTGYQVKESDVVKVEGEKIIKNENLVYYMVNKPTGYLSQTKEDKNKKTAGELVPDDYKLYPLGRLESYMSGLLVLTNDKDFIETVNNSKVLLEKEYKVKVEGLLRREESKTISKGITFPEYKTAPIKLLDVTYNDDKTSTSMTVILKETKNREVERCFEYVNHKVKSIKRVRLGNLRLDVDNGSYRRLKPHEVKLLKLLALGKISK